MDRYRIFLPLLLTVFFSAAAFLGIIVLWPASAIVESPLPQQKTNTLLTPAEAAHIAQNRFPNGQIQTIVLEETPTAYYYVVTIDTLDQGLYQLEIALPDGQIRSAQALNEPPMTLLTLADIAQKLEDDYPAAHILALTLQSEDYFPYYQAELAQDHTHITITLQPTDALILKEQRTPLKTVAANLSPFSQLLRLASASLPQTQLTGLARDSSGGFSALYQDESYQYTLLFDAQGSELQRTTTPLAAQNLPSGLQYAQGTLAPSE